MEQSRLTAPTPESDAFWLATRILSVPRMPTQALAVFPGLGDDTRVSYAVNRWHGGTYEHFLVSGCGQGERTARRFTLETLQRNPFGLIRTTNVHTQVEAANTLEQCRWVAEKLSGLGLHSVGIVAPPFHLPRVFLTLLKQVREICGHWVIMVPDPVPAPPCAISPENNLTATGLAPAEFERIAVYQAKGDVATSEELDRYLRWLYQSCL